MTSGGILRFAQVCAVLGPFVVLFIVLKWRRRRPRLAAASAVLVTVVWGLGVWSFLIEPASLTVNTIAVTSPRWSGAPLRIGIISDTHVGAPHTDPARVRRVVELMNAQHPDVVVLLGDYAGGHEPAAVRLSPHGSQILQGIDAFAALKAPLGIISILGNHDWWYDGPAVEAALVRAHATVLINQAIRLERPGGAVWFAGLADLDSKVERTSVPQALSTVPLDAPVVLLTHWPDPFIDVPDRVALTLAGHTHCGQVNLPLLGRLVAASEGSKRWACGLYNEQGRQIFVTSGIGVSILPVRFRSPPEIAIVTLSARP